MLLLFILILVFFSIITTYIFYGLALNHRTIFLCLGGFIIIIGFAIYGTLNFKICDNNAFIQGLATINQTLSSFFPSRGGYDDITKIENTENKLQNKIEELKEAINELSSKVNKSEQSDNFDAQNEKKCTKEDSDTDSVCVIIFYWLFHLLAFLYVVSIAIAILGIEFINLLRIKFFNKPQNVFWGVYDEAMMLYESTIKNTDCNINKNNIVFVLPKNTRTWLKFTDDNQGIYTLMRKGLTWIIDDVSNIHLFKMAKRHFFLGSNHYDNIVQAEKLIKELKKIDVQHDISIYVRAYALAEDDAIYKWADACNNSGSNINIEIVREEAIISRKFLLDYPMLDCPNIKIHTDSATVEGEFRILVIGFGVMGERLMSDMICDAQFLSSANHRIPITVDVVDKMCTSYGWFKENCCDACTRYKINFNNWDAGCEDFWNFLIKKEIAYNRIVICTSDDAFNLKLANDIANFYAIRFRMLPDDLKKTIFTRVRNYELVKSLPQNIKKNDVLIWERPYEIFGDIANTYSVKYLLNDKWNEGAICLNDTYNKKLILPAKEKWKLTSMQDKESSRASVYYQRNLLRLMGYVVKPETPSEDEKCQQNLQPVTADHLEKIIKGEKYLPILSESEHCRWMAFFFVRGWQSWRPTEKELSHLSEGNKKVKPNSMKGKAHIHANLFDFIELDAIDDLFNKENIKNKKDLVNSRKKDNDLVEGIKSLYKAGFFVAKKGGNENNVQ